MKYVYIFVFISILATHVATAQPNLSSANRVPHTHSHSSEDILITIRGMVCSFCAQGIKKKVSSLSSVSKVVVSLEHNLVAIYLKKGEKVSDKILKTAIEKAGYAVEKIDRK